MKKRAENILYFLMTRFVIYSSIPFNKLIVTGEFL